MNLRSIVRQGNHGNRKNTVVIPGKPCVNAVVRMEKTCILSAQLYTAKNPAGLALMDKSVLPMPVRTYARSTGKGGSFVHAEAETLYFCFRGANGLDDISAALFSSNPVLFASGYDKGQPMLVHKGFRDIYDAFKDDILEDINSIATDVKVSRIVFAGHSMGGSIAMLSAVDISRYIREKRSGNPRIEVHTYGTPKTGNKAFLQSLPKDSYIVRHPFDVVPLVNLNDLLWFAEGIVLPKCIGDAGTTECEDPGITRLIEFHSTANYIKFVQDYKKYMRKI